VWPLFLEATVKSDLDTLNSNVVAARDTLKSGGGTIQAAATSIKTLLGTPDNPNGDTVHGLVTDVKNDIDPAALDVEEALANVGGVLKADPTTATANTDLKKQADDTKTAVGVPASNPLGNTIDGCVADLKSDIDNVTAPASLQVALANVGRQAKGRSHGHGRRRRSVHTVE
jgi:copper chaperone CopZ